MYCISWALVLCRHHGIYYALHKMLVEIFILTSSWRAYGLGDCRTSLIICCIVFALSLFRVRARALPLVRFPFPNVILSPGEILFVSQFFSVLFIALCVFPSRRIQWEENFPNEFVRSTFQWYYDGWKLLTNHYFCTFCFWAKDICNMECSVWCCFGLVWFRRMHWMKNWVVVAWMLKMAIRMH